MYFMVNYDEIADRIKEVAGLLRMNRTEFGRAAGVTKVAAGLWFKGQSRPREQALTKLKNGLRVNPDYILYGKGKPLLPHPGVKEDTGGHVDYRKIKLMQLYERCDAEQQAAIINLLECFTKWHIMEESSNENSELVTRKQA